MFGRHLNFASDTLSLYVDEFQKNEIHNILYLHYFRNMFHLLIKINLKMKYSQLINFFEVLLADRPTHQ